MQEIKSHYKSYWFLNGHLHKFCRRLPGDIVETFDFDDGVYKKYYASVWNSQRERAWTLRHLAEFFGRSLYRMRDWVFEGTIPRGHMAWSLINPDKPIAEFWTADEVWDCWHVAKQIHKGRPRKDGQATSPVLSAAELRARLNGETVVYVKKDGELVPVWKELI